MLPTIKKETIHSMGIDSGIYTSDSLDEYILLTDIACYKSPEPKDVVKNRLRSKGNTCLFKLWGQLHNPNFKRVEFDSFREQAGCNTFTLSP